MHNAVGAHIYAGGFTVGVSKHFNVLAHLEHAAYGSDVVKLNFPSIPVHAGGPSAWPKKWPSGKDRPRFIYANPPCAIWSGASAGRATSWQDDPRLQFHHDIFALLPEMAPDVMAIESVPPIFTKGRSHVDALVEKAERDGYSTTVVAHNAKYLGVAQSRSRIFLVFHKVAIDWEIPAFDHQTTVRQALKGISKRTRGYDPTIRSEKLLHLLEHAGPGTRIRNTFDLLNINPIQNRLGHIVGRPSFLETRYPLDKPGPVVIAGKSIHPTEPRYLNQEELASICSFPSDYLWPKSDAQTITGYMSRGVMPKVGEWLAENVARAIDAGKRINQPRQEVLDITGPPGSLRNLTPAPQPEPERSYHEMPKNAPPPVRTSRLPDNVPGEGSGLYMRRLLAAGYGSAEILDAVHRQFPGSKAGPSDVSYNKNKLKKEGLPGAAPVKAAQVPLPFTAPKVRPNGSTPPAAPTGAEKGISNGPALTELANALRAALRAVETMRRGV